MSDGKLIHLPSYRTPSPPPDEQPPPLRPRLISYTPLVDGQRVAMHVILPPRRRFWFFWTKPKAGIFVGRATEWWRAEESWNRYTKAYSYKSVWKVRNGALIEALTHLWLNRRELTETRPPSDDT